MKKVILFAVLIGFVACRFGYANVDVYHQAIAAMQHRDNSKFAELIEKISNIDSLIIFPTQNERYSLLGYACLYRNCNVAMQLVEKKADIKEVYTDDIYGYDALYVAINSRNLCIIELLLNHGANVNTIYDENGSTPLSIACTIGDYAIVRKLLDKGADVNGGGDCGGDYILYPLLISIQKGDTDIIKLLLLAGADTNIQDKQGHTLGDYIKDSDNKDIKSLFKQ